MMYVRIHSRSSASPAGKNPPASGIGSFSYSFLLAYRLHRAAGEDAIDRFRARGYLFELRAGKDEAGIEQSPQSGLVEHAAADHLQGDQVFLAIARLRGEIECKGAEKAAPAAEIGPVA